MQPSYAFWVPGQPVPQPRPRVTKWGVYETKAVRDWKGLVLEQAMGVCPTLPLDGPLSVRMAFYRKRPGRLLRRKDPAEAVVMTARPDTDNLAKAVMDAMGDAGFWVDDSQVVQLEVTKWYAPKHCEAGVYVEVGDFLVQGIDATPV